ncbi:nuclear transport factor 2 family protein [Mucilaginibacter agri]|uniref:Lumazine-binding n=1 Tax=Mucilaginibacter agri TaxID=2695265 RepID=A0A966DTP4_9SPHI|nr:nuclear transport factor 2 family protein [Mucilaginibacter agri]NCD71483.1 hypothetical protein [Mucilaginibacter agri]
MKTLKSIAIAACLFMTVGFAKAAPKTIDDNAASANSAVNTYVAAVSQGKTEGFGKVVDPSAQFSILQGKNILSFSKADMMAFVKENKNINQECKTSTSVVESNPDMTVVKVDMDYGNFVRTNYVTLNNMAGTWKITNVYSVVK